MAREELEAFAEREGITLKAEFVPWSQSRNKGEERPSLNWRVTVLREGKPVLTTDYGAGVGHCPSYQQRATVDSAAAVRRECETGQYQKAPGVKVPILPDLADVLASLAMDSEVLDCRSFEDWAEEMGYDSDSRKAEGIYQACLAIALQMRAGLGEEGLRELREAAQDY